jgi:hypothetical protein
MNVLLRRCGLGLYYAGRRHWAGDRESAMELKSIEEAAEVSREEDFKELEIVVNYGDSSCELVLPLKPKADAREKPRDVAE